MIKLNLDFRLCLGKISNLRLTYSLQDEIELRRLRTENRLLRQRIDLLENESSELADKLIQVMIGGQYDGGDDGERKGGGEESEEPTARVKVCVDRLQF